MNAISITPYDRDMKTHVEALNIKNRFLIMGFDRLGSFIGVVQNSEVDGCDGYAGSKKLTSFWNGRIKDDKLNRSLITLLEKLKNE